MLFARTLTKPEEESLRSLSRSNITIIHRHARIILLSVERSKVSEIAGKLGLCTATVRSVIKGFNSFGVDSIYPRKKSGRPRKCDSGTEDRIIELLRKKPLEFGIESGVWTLCDARDAAGKTGIVDGIGIETLRRILFRNSLSWKRVKGWIRPSDPAYQEKKQKRDDAVRRVLLSDDWDLEYTDESWLVAQKPEGVVNPHMGECWSPVGEPAKVMTSNTKSTMTVPMYAGVSIKDKQMYYRFTDKVESAETISYLSWRAEQGKKKGLRRLFIVWDNASWHMSKMVKEWLRIYNKEARENGGTIISPILLPKRSPWLNPIESLFRWLKSKAIFFRIHENLEILKEMVMKVIDQRNDKKAGRLGKVKTTCEKGH